MDIKQSKDYEQFSSVKGNRQLLLNHLADLTTSILKRNLLQYNPIIVNEQMQIIDGQHRFEVAKANNLPIYYVVIENAGVDEVMLLNKTNRKWYSMNYIYSFATRGFKEYQWLLEFMENYKLSFTQAMWCIFGQRTGHTSRTIESGKFEANASQKALAEERADMVWTIRPFFLEKGPRRVTQAIMGAIVQLSNEGLGRKLIEAVKNHGKPFRPSLLYAEAVGQLREILKEGE